MIQCVNKECDNYKHELEEHVKVCPLCGIETQNIITKTDTKNRYNMILTIVSFAALILTMIILTNFDSFVALFIGFGSMFACIIISIIMRLKMAIVVSILCAAFVFGMLFYFGFFDMLF